MNKQAAIVTETKVDLLVNKRIMIPIIIAMVGIVAGSLFLYTKYISPSKKIAAQKLNPQKEAESLLAKIGALYDLPKGEAPTIATVSDKTKLQNQPFFAKAENGDKVLIYTNAKKALLYRPSINKIMEVSSLAINSPTGSPTAPSVSPPVPTIEKIISMSIYNGTEITGLASTTEKKVTEKYKNIIVKEKDNAEKEYTKIIVIDITKNNKEMAQNIASLLGGAIGTLPQGEKTPKGEILVILGK